MGREDLVQSDTAQGGPPIGHPDSDMVERVAAALARLPIRDLNNPGSELDGLRLREAARAAIAAMREKP